VTLARGVLTFVGSITAAVSGFALAVLVGRSLGTSGSGIFFTVVATVTMVSTYMKLGADTAQLWRVPRLLTEGRVDELRPTVRLAIGASTGASALAGVALVVLATPIGERVTSAEASSSVHLQLVLAGVAVLLATPMAVMIATTRALGAVLPFIGLQNVLLPLGRLLAVAVVLASGLGGVAVMGAWTTPLVIVLFMSWLAARSLVTAEIDRSPATAPARSQREIRRTFWGFAIPRGLTASMEVTLISVNTVIVAWYLGPSAAGVFGALSRFITTGTLAEQAVRILVAPRFSALLSVGDRAGTDALYRLTTPWIVAVSWPIFLVLGIGAPQLLAVFGEGFVTGAAALSVLAGVMCISQLAGNVQTVLLMSGRSDLQLVNKAVAIMWLLAMNAALLPRLGLLGAAIAWGSAILVDTALAVLQVRRVVGLSFRVPRLARLAATAVATFGVPMVVTRAFDSDTVTTIFVVGLGGTVYLVVLWSWRRALGIDEIVGGDGDPLMEGDASTGEGHR
jgi:O-antigen/teichoic acid export membrane protein